MSVDTVGTLLASIANSLNDGLRMLMFADKRQWGPDEFEQVRALEESLDEAKKDFQSLAPLVNGQFYYENDRNSDSLTELRELKTKFEQHVQNFKDWLRSGGPINAAWALETVELRRELHRAQCRAACRMFATSPGEPRCLGGFLVRRRQREMAAAAQRRKSAIAAAGRGGGVESDPERGLSSPLSAGPDEGRNGEGNEDGRRRSLEALVPECNAVGRFERFGDRDVAFVCDFCDGFLVWEDLKKMPSTRTPEPKTLTPEPYLGAIGNPALAVAMGSSLRVDSSLSVPSPTTPMSPTKSKKHHRLSGIGVGGVGDFAGLAHPNWQATGESLSTGEHKQIVFAPLAIANHLLPAQGDWKSHLMCPYCDELTYFDDDGGGLELRYAQDERGLEDVKAFQEHLEWYHAGMTMPSGPTKKTNCCVM